MVNSENRRPTQFSNTPVKRRNTEQKAETPQTPDANAPKSSGKPTRWVQIRLFPIWLRVIVVLLLIFAAAMVGLNVGYTVLGDGESQGIFKWSTWQHVLDIINGVE